jgi:hypothetical protein
MILSTQTSGRYFSVRKGLVSAFLALTLFFCAAPGSMAARTTEVQSISVASFSGFAPGAQIETQIVLPSARTSLTTAIDSGGAATLHKKEDLSKVLAYAFDIQQGQKPISVSLQRTADQKNLALVASGVVPFSRLVVETAQGQQTLYSDWAGLVRSSEINPPASGADQSFKIALYGGIMNDAQIDQPHPMLIKIDFAPPGAGSTTTPYGPIHHGSVKENYIHPLQMFAEQLSAVAMHYMFAIGTFLDAKEQLETQRDFQKLRAEAHKDYHPSEQMCMIGGFTKSLAATEAKGFNDQEAVNSALLTAYRNLNNSSTIDGPDVDMENRLQQYREIYCDPQDANTALFGLCQHDKDGNRNNSTLRAAPPRGLGAEKPVRMNKDIDFVRTIDFPLTMDIDFTDDKRTEDEEDIMALARNLYWPVPHKKVNDLRAEQDEMDYTKMRSIMAMSSIAHNSFAKIVAMKAKAPEPTIDDPGWAYMKTMMREFGLTDEKIAQLIGKNPSYFAQMDVLTKKMYQNPDFYTHLYDKPVNISRIGASMQAIELMQGRDHFDAALRREMLLSSLVEEQLVDRANRVQAKTLDTKDTRQ